MATPAGIEHIMDGAQTLAILVRQEYRAEGIRFFTPDEFSQQLAYMRWPAGHVVAEHRHQPVPRTVHYTQETLFVKSGRIQVDFYSDACEHVTSRELAAGDVMLLASGGHGIEMLEESEIIEVKQGPYAGADDKVRFTARTKCRG